MKLSRARLTDDEIRQRLGQLDGWHFQGGKLHKDYQFRDFAQAFAWMTRVAEQAEALDHHPEWFNVYRDVRVDLATHDAGGVTEYDFELARRMDAAVQS